jgi:hypothetical protein
MMLSEVVFALPGMNETVDAKEVDAKEVSAVAAISSRGLPNPNISLYAPMQEYGVLKPLDIGKRLGESY